MLDTTSLGNQPLAYSGSMNSNFSQSHLMPSPLLQHPQILIHPIDSTFISIFDLQANTSRPSLDEFSGSTRDWLEATRGLTPTLTELKSTCAQWRTISREKNRRNETERRPSTLHRDSYQTVRVELLVTPHLTLPNINFLPSYVR